MSTTNASTTGTDDAAAARTISLPSVRRRGVSKIVVVAWVIAALGVGFAVGRLLPAGFLGIG